jgi:hypothetical protein
MIKKVRHNCEVTEITDYFVRVKHGEGITESELLCGWAKPKNVKIGDKGDLEYDVQPSYAVWMFRKYNKPSI